MKKDLETCIKDLERENSPERPESQRPATEMPKLPSGRWDSTALQSAREVSLSIPHFSLRLAILLDDLVRGKPDSPLRKYRLELVGFPFCKSLVQTLFKVVCKKRRQIVTERPTFIRNTPETEKDYNDQVLKMPNDLIDMQSIEPELDKFNKESFMGGLKFLGKRTHALADDEAAHIFENLQWLPIALAQFRACDYIIEEVDDLITILITA